MLTRSGAAGVRRRRDACTGTIELLERRTEVLELKEILTDDDRQSALRMSGLIGTITSDFKKFHFTLVDSIEEEEEARAEQTVLHDHELKVMDLIDRLGRLVAVPQKNKPMTALDLLRKRIDQVEKNYGITRAELDEHGHEMDIYKLQEQEESIDDSKSEIRKISRDLLSMEDVGDLEDKVTMLERLLRALKTDVKRLVGRKEEKPNPPPAIGVMGMSGIQLPKIEVPTFDGDLLNWRYFWEQFENTIHNKTQLTDIDKLTYLRDALKDSPARYVVSGLTQTAESYGEAIKCLQERYDRPRVLHQAHVRKIQEATPLKTGSGPELRRLHDLLVQHVRALKTLEQDTLETYLTAAIELKLDEGTKLKWAEYSSERETTPPYEELLKFLDIQARHHESVIQGVRRTHTSGTDKKYTSRTSYAATPESMCVACKKETHQLHNCGAFQKMPREERWEIIKKNGCCLNCLRGGHMANKCRAPPACRKCRKAHHTLLHIEKIEPARETPHTETASSATYVPPHKRNKQVLLMTCRAKITGPDGTSTQARVFLDPGAACSFVTERLAQQLRLPRGKTNTMIAGIAGINTTRTRGAVSFMVGHARGDGRKIHVNDAFVLSRITTDMPSSQVGSIGKWKHLAGLDLSDPDFGMPARVDVLLGADYYGEALLHGRRCGPKGTPYAQKTCFGWVLAGPFSTEAPKPSAYTCCVAVENDSLKKFWEIEDYNLNRPVLSIEEKSVIEHFDSSHSIDESGRFIVPLPRKTGVVQLGESRKQALERFSRLESSLRKKGTYEEFADVIREYFELEHAEPVPAENLERECTEV